MVKAVAVLGGSEAVMGTVYFTQEGDVSKIKGVKRIVEFQHRHAGDLGNVTVGDDGTVNFSVIDNQIPLTEPNSIIGRVVVHADPDDLGKARHELSKTTGNAGGRVACGIIGLQA